MSPASEIGAPTHVLAAGAGAVFLVSFALSGVGGQALRRAGAVDAPGERRSHTRPTPRGGGLGVAVGWLLALGALAVLEPRGPWLVLAGSAGAMAVLGLLDDLRDLGTMARLLVQLAIAAGALLALAPGPLPIGPWLWPAGVAPGALLVLALAACANFYNFMDGIDGLASLEAVFAGTLLALLAAAAGDATLAAACLALALASAGFVPWNFPRARVFMGDCGSTMLGLGLALLGLVGALRDAWTLLLPVLVTSVFLVDALATLLVRMARGERWYTAHREHAYQRLTDRGWAHHRVTLCYLAVNMLVVLPVAWGVRDSAAVQPVACIAVWTLLGLLWVSARRR